ncbi:MAG: DUF2269 family protein [Anaerolineales bacterium]|nr:DUF2269 family protein [Anaerolineales bacterium]
MSWYVVLKWIHVLSAIVAVGSNLTYRMLLLSAGGKREANLFALNAIRFLDRRLANPAYLMLLITGLSMVFIAGFPITTPWILTSLILYFVIVFLGIKVYAPVFRKQIRLAQEEGVDGSEYLQTARRAGWIEAAVTLVAVLIVFLMVTKPYLW